MRGFSDWWGLGYIGVSLQAILLIRGLVLNLDYLLLLNSSRGLTGSDKLWEKFLSWGGFSGWSCLRGGFKTFRLASPSFAG